MSRIHEGRAVVVVISASVGGGHDGAARELARRLEAEHGCSVHVLDFLALMPFGLGRLIRGSYAWQLRAAPWSYQWLYGVLERRPRYARMVCRFTNLSRRRLDRAVGRDGLALVVSTYPLASQALAKARRRGRLPVPLVTVLTDFSVHRLWVSEEVDEHLALHPVTVRQAEDLGAPSARQVAPLVPQHFRERPSRDEARERWELPAEARVALLTAGSWGVGDIAPTAEALASGGEVVPVVLCGTNEELRGRLERDLAGTSVVPLGWVEDMASLFAACDVVVQNAGGLTCLEAFASGVPVASLRCLPGHGLHNAAAMEEAGVAVWVQDPDALPETIEELAGELGRRQAALADDLFERPDPAQVCADLMANWTPRSIGRPRRAMTGAA